MRTITPPAVRKNAPGEVKAILDAEGAEAILDALEDGQSLLQISTRLGVSRRGLGRWLKDNGHEEASIHARKAAAEAYDEMALEVIRAAKGKSRAEVSRANFEANQLRWRAQALNPDTYGTKSEVKVTTEIQDLTDEELVRRYESLSAAMAKGEAL